MATPKHQEHIQIIVYIRRKPDLTQEQFYKHWEDVHAPTVVPWAEKHGFERYQQMHVSGLVVPNAASTQTASSPIPVEPYRGHTEFDGIAVFVVPSLEHFNNAFNDPYYIEVIEPDEKKFVDKEGLGGGLVARFQGKMLDIGLDRKSMFGTTERSDNYRNAFEKFERERKAHDSILDTEKLKL